jgi:hypothetical protein
LHHPVIDTRAGHPGAQERKRCASAPSSLPRIRAKRTVWLTLAATLLVAASAAASGTAPAPQPAPTSASGSSPTPDPTPQATASQSQQPASSPAQPTLLPSAPSAVPAPSGGALVHIPSQSATPPPAAVRSTVIPSPRPLRPTATHSRRVSRSGGGSVSEAPLRTLRAWMRGQFDPISGVLGPATVRRSGALLLLSALALLTLVCASSMLVRLLARLDGHWREEAGA